MWEIIHSFTIGVFKVAQISRSIVKSETNESLQLTQNRMLRVINNSKIKDKISVSCTLKKFNLRSVNHQLAAQIKLVEAWKTINLENYPIQLENNQLSRNTNGRAVRESTIKLWKDDTKVANAKESFLRDAAKLWNNAPTNVKKAKSLYMAKKVIITYCKSLIF